MNYLKIIYYLSGKEALAVQTNATLYSMYNKASISKGYDKEAWQNTTFADD